MEILDRRIGVKKASLTTIHAYTASQAIVDGARSRVRMGRAAATNIVPATTGAATATTRALPGYRERFDGVAFRVPVTVGSLADVVAIASRPTTVAEVNDVFTEESQGERYKHVLGVTTDPIVSSDIVKDPRAAIVDLGLTQVVDGDLVKVIGWYDNDGGTRVKWFARQFASPVATDGEGRAANDGYADDDRFAAGDPYVQVVVVPLHAQGLGIGPAFVKAITEGRGGSAEPRSDGLDRQRVHHPLAL